MRLASFAASSTSTLLRTNHSHRQTSHPSIVFTPRKLSVHRHATEGNDADQAPIEKQPQTQQSSATIARGQTTAIVTGAISIIFGVAYLALVQFMDMRGGELLPPPPEAFME